MDEVRPDVLLMDDYDTDDECRNPETVNNKWNWFEQALFFTRSDAEAIIKLAKEKNPAIRVLDYEAAPKQTSKKRKKK